eukprot:GHVN01086246.1.p1 GENE.GHVN01086246.1~~GHVN01086246.1.p1  ORF type:complete len:251 (-),score=57.23 GHVN01086246.1:235-921(-)
MAAPSSPHSPVPPDSHHSKSRRQTQTTTPCLKTWASPHSDLTTARIPPDSDSIPLQFDAPDQPLLLSHESLSPHVRRAASAAEPLTCSRDAQNLYGPHTPSPLSVTPPPSHFTQALCVWSLSVDKIQWWTDTLRVAPECQHDDGLGYLCAVMNTPATTRFSMMTVMLGLLDEGRIKRLSFVQSTPSEKFWLKFSAPGVVCLDGEFVRHDGQVKLTVMPKSLSLVVPAC